MIETTVSEIKNGFCHPTTQRIYVIEGDGCVIYVGQSKCAITRMESHLGRGEWRGFFGSDLDYMLIRNPKAGGYKVTFYDDADIARYAVSLGYAADVSTLEDDLIYELSPVFNAQGKKKNRDNIDRWYALYPPKAISMVEMEFD